MPGKDRYQEGGGLMMRMDSSYCPVAADISPFEKLGKRTVLYLLSAAEEFNFDPGQFFMLTLPGVGEIAVTPSLTDKGMEIIIEERGPVTAALNAVKRKRAVGIRGPYGKGVPPEVLYNREVLLAAVHEGIIKIKPVMEMMLSRKEDYPRIVLACWGTGEYRQIYDSFSGKWKDEVEVHMLEIGKKGLSGIPADKDMESIDIDYSYSVAVVAGSRLAVRRIGEAAVRAGLEEENVFVFIEEPMTCGIGHCRRCMVGDRYVCREGPVFAYKDIRESGNFWNDIG